MKIQLTQRPAGYFMETILGKMVRGLFFLMKLKKQCVCGKQSIIQKDILLEGAAHVLIWVRNEWLRKHQSALAVIIFQAWMKVNPNQIVTSRSERYTG